MTTINRPALGTLSTNIMNQPVHEGSKKPMLPRLKAVIPQISITKHVVSKPQSHKDISTNAEKLKYRLQIAYYKLRTDQVSLSINEIMENHKERVKPQVQPETARKVHVTAKPNQKAPNVTPSLTRHISLLAASTPLHSNTSSQNLPKKVTFTRSTSYLEPAKIKSDCKSSAASSRAFEYIQNPQLRTTSSPNLRMNKRSLKIGDLVHANITLEGNTTIQDSDATISNMDITPIKGHRTDDNGELLLSSPTKKKFSSTPGSYGAAKSLLQLSLISSN